jgi:hypothetical protein
VNWLLLARFWWVPVSGALIAALWWQGLSADKVRDDRDRWHSSALEYQVSAGEWEASFKASEKARRIEQEAAVGAINASEASCAQRIEKARSSALKIEKVVSSVQPVCKPGEAIERRLLDPAELRDSIGLR